MFVFVCLFMIFSGLLVFISSRKYFLLTLLSIEYLLLANYCLLFFYLYLYSVSFYFILVFLTFIVCEGSLGLSILVSIIRSHGNDHVSSSSMLLW